MSMEENKRIIIALDVFTLEEVKHIVDLLGESILWYKVGLKLYLSSGVPVIEYLKSRNKKIFLDLKFLDIPNTVSSAVHSIIPLEVDFITIHALGGSNMIKGAREAIDSKSSKTKILSVTILTSIDKNILNNDMGLAGEVEENVVRLAKMAIENGTHGIVSSPMEIKPIRKIDKDVIIVTPGIRFESDSLGDQKRVMTPKEALQSGSNYLVMGRSLIGKSDSKELIHEINKVEL